MAISQGSKEPVILFTHGDTAYEYLAGRGVGPNGESLVEARRRTGDAIGEKVLLKSWPTQDATQSGRRIRARLVEEARLGTYLRHPAILRVEGPYEAHDTLYTVVEYAPGLNLTDLVTLSQERGQYPSEAFTLYLGATLASALGHAHTRVDEHGQPLKIVHRNLHPSTIRLTWEGAVKLGDFGMAHSLMSGRLRTTHLGPRLPAFYTAPEVLLGAPVDVQAELFALGLVLLEVCTGRCPLDAPDRAPSEVEALLSKKNQRRIRRRVRMLLKAGLDERVETATWGAATFDSAAVEQAVEGLSEPLKAIFRSLLQGKPALRPWTAAAVEKTLLAALAERGSYGAREALAEMERIMSDAGAALVQHGTSGSTRQMLRSPEEVATR
ncbi:MAG TPA: protein kinase [Myxococcaceae bacterium]|jgi:serine/threonine protein kinase